jgi:flagellar protein FliS
LSYRGLNSYRQTQVQSRTPLELVVMLYDGAIRFLRQSSEAMRVGNREQARDRMRRAEAIIDELNYTLDMSYGQVPENLRLIYNFCKRQLVKANLESDPQSIDAVSRMLAELRESWARIAERAEVA